MFSHFWRIIVGVGVGVGVADGLGDTVDDGLTTGFTGMPLFQMNFLPDLIQVNLVLFTIFEAFRFMHLAPAKVAD